MEDEHIMSPTISGINTVPRSEFTRLFGMQAHAANFGIGFAALWFFGMFYYYRHSLTPIVKDLSQAVIMGALAGILFFASTVIATSYTNTENQSSKSDSDCGWLLRLCSLLCILGMSVLITATSGFHSPFIPLYVMVFVLTLENIAEDSSRWHLCIFFLLPIVAACSLARNLSIFDDNFLKANVNDDFFQLSLATGLVLSFLVPTWSADRLAKRIAKNKATHDHPNPMQGES